MFDIGFSEIVVIGVIALIVFGPEELPRVARLAGKMLGNFRHYVDQVKSELDQEIQASELKELGQEIKDSAQTFRSSLTEQMKAVESEVQNAKQEISGVAKEVAIPVKDAVSETKEVLLSQGQIQTSSDHEDNPEPIASPIEEMTTEGLVPPSQGSAAEVAQNSTQAPDHPTDPEIKGDSALAEQDNKDQLDLFGLSGPSSVPHKS